jgi:hypothetical protein
VIEHEGTTEKANGRVDVGLKTICPTFRCIGESYVVVVQSRQYESLNKFTLGMAIETVANEVQLT